MEDRLPSVDPTALLVEEQPETLHSYARALWDQFRSLKGKDIPGYPVPGYKIPKVKAATIWLLGQYHNANLPPHELVCLLTLASVPKRKKAALAQELTPNLKIEHTTVVKARNLILEAASDPASIENASTFREVQLKNYPAYWAALRFEAKHPVHPTGKHPSVASRYAVAKHVLDSVGLPNQGKRRSVSTEILERGPARAARLKKAERTVETWRENDHYRSNVAFLRELTKESSLRSLSNDKADK